MSTLANIRDNIRNTPDKGKSNRARDYSDRQIELWIHATRNYLMTKDIEKYTSNPANVEQDLGCWPLETVDQANCPDWLWGDNIKVCKFPEVIEADRNKGLTFFGLIDKRTRIYIPESNFGSLDDYRRFKGKNDRYGYMIDPGTVYLKGNGVERLKTVNVRGIFKDPTLVSYYSEIGEQHCYDKNKTPYPITADLERVLYEVIFADYIMKFAGAPADDKNDERSEKLV